MDAQIKEKILNHNQKFNLIFLEEEHKYFIEENLELESVTTRISRYFPFNQKKVSRDVAMRNWTTEEEVLDEWEVLRNNGSYVHDLADKFCTNQKLDDRELEVIKNVKQFFEDHKDYEIVASEIRIFSKKFGVAGTVDIILREKSTDRIYLLDWKTSRKEISKNDIFSMAKEPFETLPNNKFNIYSLQLSVYSKILEEEYGIVVWDSFIVHLKMDGTYKVITPMNLFYEAQMLLEDCKLLNI